MTTLGRRASQRICLHSDVGILDEGSGGRLLGRLRDLSASGASLATNEPLALGKELRLAFEFIAGEPPIRLHAEVIWTGRAAAPRGTVLTGLRFTDLAGAEAARLRGFIDKKLWAIQSFLCNVALFSDLSDLEKLLLASVVLDRDLAEGAGLDETLVDGSLLIVRSGTLHCREVLADGRASTPRTIGAGELCGGLPIDPNGTTRVVCKAATPTALLVVTADSFYYLQQTHPELAFKLVSAWALTLRDALFAVEPQA